MKLLNKKQILDADDLPFEDVPVPEFGADAVVRVRTMSAADRDKWEQELVVAEPIGKDEQGRLLEKRTPNLVNVRARLVAFCAVDDAGQRLFTTAEDVLALGQKSAFALDRIIGVCRKLNKLNAEDLNTEVGKSEPSRR